MFQNLIIGQTYSRPELAKLWGYKGYEAIARGVVTPANKDKIIIFVTREKQASYEQYKNNLVGDLLEWEGPTDHFAEGRMLSAHQTGDEIHVFYRARHHSDFEYKGVANVEEHELRQDAPSSFKLRLLS